ncbi:MAG: hypothetical protein ACPHUF_14145, partial [Gammaproteobacteria bacterium]
MAKATIEQARIGNIIHPPALTNSNTVCFYSNSLSALLAGADITKPRQSPIGASLLRAAGHAEDQKFARWLRALCTLYPCGRTSTRTAPASAVLNQDDADADGISTCDGDCDDADANTGPGFLDAPDPSYVDS